MQPVGFVGRNWVTQLDFSHITKNFLRRKRFEIQQLYQNPLEHSDISFARGCCPAKIHILGQSPTSHKWQHTDSTPPRPNPISLSVPPIAKRPTTTHPPKPIVRNFTDPANFRLGTKDTFYSAPAKKSLFLETFCENLSVVIEQLITPTS